MIYGSMLAASIATLHQAQSCLVERLAGAILEGMLAHVQQQSFAGSIVCRGQQPGNFCIKQHLQECEGKCQAGKLRMV